ncbi:MAG TPA: helix-turn-helix domain-containing protein [Gryllotalpicola sp.]
MVSQSADDAGRFLTVVDCAEILNVEAEDVAALLESGELPAIRVSEQWRVEREVLETYITELYEQQRRRALWEQSDFASLAELSGGTILRPGD